MTASDHTIITLVPHGIGTVRYVISMGLSGSGNISCSGIVEWKHLWGEIEQKTSDMLVDKMNLEGK